MIRYSCSARRHLELGEDTGQVEFDRLRTDKQQAGGLAVAHARSDE